MMTILTRRLFAAVTLALLAAPLWAETPPNMELIFCVQGEGCWQGRSDLTAAEAQALLGPERAPAEMTAATHRLVQMRGVSAPMVTTMTPQMLHAAYGGQGEIGALVLSPGDAGAHAPGKVFTPEDLGADLTIPLFAPEADAAPVSAPVSTSATGLVPLDGLWQVTPRDQAFEGCSPMLESMLGPMMATQQPQGARQITWGGRFDPSVLDFLNGDGQKVEWTRTGPDRFEGVLLDQGSDEVSLRSEVAMQLLASDHIAATSTLDISTMLEGLGQVEMQALGLAGCQVRLRFDLRHAG